MTDNYLDVLRRRNLFTWVWALLAAISTNVILFIVMPMLQNHENTCLPHAGSVPDVEVVRLQPKERIRHEPTPSKEEPEMMQKAVRPPPRAPEPVMSRPLSLPFKIDPGFQPAMEGVGKLPWDFNLGTDVQPEGIFSADVLDARIGVQVRVPPVYPIRARERRIEGWVKVKLLVDEAGLVERAEVVEANPPGYFEKSVLSCVRKWKLTPPTVDGSPVKAWMLTRIKFKLE